MMPQKRIEAFLLRDMFIQMRLKQLFSEVAMVCPPDNAPTWLMKIARLSARRLAPISVALLISATSPTHAHIAKTHHIPGKPEFTDPRQVVEIFLEAVDRGELIVFDQKLDKSRIIPVRVEYVYDLDSLTPKMKVYSELKHPLPVPGDPDCRLRGVSAVLDNYGHIIETAAHIWPVESE